MTIEEHLEKAKNKTNTDTDYGFSHEELESLLHQVAKEQRNECAKEYYKQGYEYEKFDPSIQDYINNAPSPLD